MKTFTPILLLILISALANAQVPKLYVQIVSHNEPSDSLEQNLKYAKAKNNVLQLANIVDSKNAKWNLQTSDGFVMGARTDEIITTHNIFETLAMPPFSDNIEIDPRSKNNLGRNIADQWYLLDSLGANPTTTVGGFIYYVCPPSSSLNIDWWQYEDTLVGTHYGNKVKFTLLSGAGSLPAHCNDLNDFGIFKPDTTTNFYNHNPARNLWCIGTGCAPVLDSTTVEQDIIDLIQGQVDSIQTGLWPADKFYNTRIMTNQRDYGPAFFQKISNVIDSLNKLPFTKFQWANLSESLAAFNAWRLNTGMDSSQWLCGQAASVINENTSEKKSFFVIPNPSTGTFSILFNDNKTHKIELYDFMGKLLHYVAARNTSEFSISIFPNGLYFVKVDEKEFEKIVKE